MSLCHTSPTYALNLFLNFEHIQSRRSIDLLLDMSHPMIRSRQFVTADLFKIHEIDRRVHKWRWIRCELYATEEHMHMNEKDNMSSRCMNQSMVSIAIQGDVYTTKIFLRLIELQNDIDWFQMHSSLSNSDNWTDTQLSIDGM